MSNVKAGKDNLNKPIREIFIEELRKGNSVRMNIKGSCMHPLIRKDDIVMVRPIKFEETKVGDVVVYTRNFHYAFTVHRLIRKNRDRQGRKCLTTRGDANRYGDPAVYPQEVYGKAVAIERRNGTITHLDTRYRRFQGYMFAKRSWLAGVLGLFLRSPHLVPIKVVLKIKSFWVR